MQIIYKPVLELSAWEKNASLRRISDDNWQKLLLSIRREGVKQAFKIGEDNIVYDGNHRLKAVRELIANGIIHSENNIDLQSVPCIVYSPHTEAQKVDLALTGNEGFASWDQEGLTAYLPEFENDLDMSLFNVDFYEPKSITDQLTEEKTKSSKEPKLVTCPNCQHQFDPKKRVDN